MSYKIKTIEPGRWLINDHIEVINGYMDIHKWLKKNTSIYDSSEPITDSEYINNILTNFLLKGFTPLLGCYGDKKFSEKDGKPYYAVNNTISWFLFDGINNNRKQSLAVNYNKEKGTYTVYYHYPNFNNRIAVFDEQSEIFKLTENYLPVHFKDCVKNDFEIDWDKVTNLCIGGNPLGFRTSKPVIYPGLVRSTLSTMYSDIFEKRVGNIINRVSKYIPDDEYKGLPDDEYKGLLGNPYDYLHRLNKNGDVIEFIYDNPATNTGFTLHFDFIDHTCVFISLLEKDGDSNICTESVMVMRMQEREIASNGTYEKVDFTNKETKTEEIIKYYLPMLGIYFAKGVECSEVTCSEAETEEKRIEQSIREI